jgi:hypothetical protein
MTLTVRSPQGSDQYETDEIRIGGANSLKPKK